MSEEFQRVIKRYKRNGIVVTNMRNKIKRIFTDKEKIYMAHLVTRNIKKKFKHAKRGLDNPMSANERMRRLRIKKKAKIAMCDLSVAEISGIIESNKIMAETWKIMTVDLIMSKDENIIMNIAINGLKYLKDTTYEEMVSNIEELFDKVKIK